MPLFDPTANAKVADLAAVAGDFQWMYAKGDDGSYAYKAEDPAVKAATSVISGLKSSLNKARLELDAAKKTVIDLAPLKDFGATPDEIATNFLEQKTKLEGQIKSVNVGQIREGITKELQPKIDAATLKANNYGNQLYRMLVVAEATTAIAAEGGTAELLLPFVQQQVKVVEDAAGVLAARVVDAQGNVRFSGAAEMTIADLIKEFKANERLGGAFASSAPRGTGMKPGSQERTAATTSANGQKSANQKIADGLAKLRK